MNSMVDLLIQGIVSSSVNFEKMPQECVPKLKPQPTVGFCTLCCLLVPYLVGLQSSPICVQASMLVVNTYQQLQKPYNILTAGD